MRKVININENWYFSKEKISFDIQPTNSWQLVTLPHTWNNIDGQDGGNDYYRGTCFYQKKIDKVDLEINGRAYLEFLGVAMTAEVFLNGKKLARHEGGYSIFRVDITDELQEENILIVSVDNSENDSVYPQKADFTFYGGIYRSVNLITVSENHFELLKDGTPGIKVTPEVLENQGIVEIETWSNGGKVRYSVLDSLNNEIASKVKEGDVKIEIEKPHLWNGLKDPYLYKVTAELLDETGEVVDQIESKFGFRHFSFDTEKGFILNGESYPLRGVSRHQDFMGVGNAINQEIEHLDMSIIKEIGANTIRLAHYQHSQTFYDLCDEVGMIVWAEIPYITKHMPNGRENTIVQMRELITQSYNHPSIICWGLSNEITVSASDKDDLTENHKILNDLCHEMDKTRPTTMAHAFMLEIDDPLVELPDLSSYNLYFGWYLGNLKQNDQFFDEYHAKYPNRMMGFSEYGADANPKFQTNNPSAGDYTESYQAVYHEHILRCIEERPYLWATHVWNMFDFAADGRDEGGKHGVNQKGLVTFDRKHKKDAFYLYKAYWSNEPFIHLCDKGYTERVEDDVVLKVYTNQKTVSLYIDNRLIETKEANRVITFDIKNIDEQRIMVKSNELVDSCVIKKVSEQNDNYLFAKEDIINWFDKEDLNAEYFSVNDSLGELAANPKSSAVLNQIMAKAKEARGDVAKESQGNENLRKMMAGTTLIQILKKAGDAVPKEQIKELNGILQTIKK